MEKIMKAAKVLTVMGSLPLRSIAMRVLVVKPLRLLLKLSQSVPIAASSQRTRRLFIRAPLNLPKTCSIRWLSK